MEQKRPLPRIRILIANGQATGGAPVEGDATGEDLLKSYLREGYATLLSTLDERHAIVFGRASSCTVPVLVRPNEASKSLGSSFVADKIPKHGRDRVRRDLLALSPGCAGDSQAGRDFGRPGPSCPMMRPTRG
jgi:hypothetical protein